MQVPSFDELDADQLKELIQSGAGKVGSGKKSKKSSAKKIKKLPLDEEKSIEKTQPDAEKREDFYRGV